MTIETKNVVLGVVAGAAAVVSGAAAASAADAGAVDDWSGFYVGGSLGYTVAGETSYWDNNGGDPYEIDGGFVGGIHAGFNHQMDSGLVLGMEAALSEGGRRAEPAGEDYDYNISPIFDVKARVGFAFDDILAYGFAGFSSMPQESSYSDYGGAYQNYGYNLGLGAEMMVTDNVSIGAEYIYRATTDHYEFDSSSYQDTATSLSEFVVRASYHFN